MLFSISAVPPKHHTLQVLLPLFFTLNFKEEGTLSRCPLIVFYSVTEFISALQRDHARGDEGDSAFFLGVGDITTFLKGSSP